MAGNKNLALMISSVKRIQLMVKRMGAPISSAAIKPVLDKLEGCIRANNAARAVS